MKSVLRGTLGRLHSDGLHHLHVISGVVLFRSGQLLEWLLERWRMFERAGASIKR